jgi:hypothetical protein
MLPLAPGNVAWAGVEPLTNPAKRVKGKSHAKSRRRPTVATPLPVFMVFPSVRIILASLEPPLHGELRLDRKGRAVSGGINHESKIE